MSTSTSTSAHHSVLRSIQLWQPKTRAQLATWVTIFLGMKMPEKPLCPHHQTPLDYLAHSFLEGNSSLATDHCPLTTSPTATPLATGGNPSGDRHAPGGDPSAKGCAHGDRAQPEPLPTPDSVVWACRGGGKTMLGAIATLLDLLFKPNIQVRILGGSFEQSEKMYAYLRSLLQRHFDHLLAAPPTHRRLLLKNGSRVDVLAQSDRSVRGQRVQKLRCDEIELFTPEVWQAAQLTTRSLAGPKPIRGAIEAFSTMHQPGGLMQKILAESAPNPAAPTSLPPRKLFAWCVWDVIEQCPPNRPCSTCPLFDACQGRAKEAQGFLKIDDVIAMRSRISQATWNHEMLCQPPRFEDAVFPAFRRELHVRPIDAGLLLPSARIHAADQNFLVDTLICGVDFGFAHAFVCLWIAMLRQTTPAFRVPNSSLPRAVWVFDELVTRELTVAKNAALMRARPNEPALVYPDVAGNHTNSQTAKSDESVLREAGFRTKSRGMEIAEGIDLIADLLDPALGPPRLFIDPKCARLIDALEGYRRKPDGSPEKDGRHDHLIDALRYALVNHDRPLAQVEIRPY